MSRLDKIGTHKTAIFRGDDGNIYVTYHDTHVAILFADGSVKLNSGGWRTATTKTRMNQALNVWGVPSRVFQRKHVWYVQRSDGTCTDFADDMVLPS